MVIQRQSPQLDLKLQVCMFVLRLAHIWVTKSFAVLLILPCTHSITPEESKSIRFLLKILCIVFYEKRARKNKGLFAPSESMSESEEDQRTSKRERISDKHQRIFFAFARCEWALTFQRIRGVQLLLFSIQRNKILSIERKSLI